LLVVLAVAVVVMNLVVMPLHLLVVVAVTLQVLLILEEAVAVVAVVSQMLRLGEAELLLLDTCLNKYEKFNYIR
jgi:hypothetical protein